MRLFPAANKKYGAFLLSAAVALAVLMPVAAQAQSARQVDEQLQARLREAVSNNQALATAYADEMGTTPTVALAQPQQNTQSMFNRARNTETMTAEELQERMKNRADPKTRAYRMAEREARTNYGRNPIVPVDEDNSLGFDMSPPPDMYTLQDVHKSHGSTQELITDTLISKEMALDMRRDAQREAALSYGARGGLAKRNFQIMERLSGYAVALDSVFEFRQLLIRAPSGLMIEPPIVRETIETIQITEGGREAAVADQVLKINRQARIVTAPRDWRQYLVMHFESDIPPPPRVLWPKNATEQAEWDSWVKRGWDAGYAQGQDIFDTNLNRLVADYQGMVRYRTLLAEGKISQPYALHEDRGVTGGGGEMRVGDRALRITGPSQFVTGAQQWKPADR